jgi:hypothetical protein
VLLPQVLGVMHGVQQLLVHVKILAPAPGKSSACQRALLIQRQACRRFSTFFDVAQSNWLTTWKAVAAGVLWRWV